MRPEHYNAEALVSPPATTPSAPGDWLVETGKLFLRQSLGPNPGLLTWSPTGFCKLASDLEELFRK